MAGEITTVTLASVTHAYLIQPVIIAALSEQPGYALRNCREFNLVGKATAAAQIPLELSYWGSPNDRGAGVATAFNASQAVALGNTPYSTGSVTCTAAEYGVAHALIDNVVEDSVDGIDFMNLFSSRMLRVLQLAWDDDYIALFASAANFVGTTNVAVTVVQMIAAQQGARSRGTVADAMEYILGTATSNNLEAALVAGSTSAAVYALSADRLINYRPSNDNGMGPSRQVMTFRGVPTYVTGLTDTANAGVDEVSAFVCPTSAMNDASGATSHAMVLKRLPRFEMQRFAKQRATDLVMTARVGFSKLQEGTTTAIITKAS